MVRMTDDHAQRLRHAAQEHRRAKKRSEAILRPAKDQLREAVQAAYADGMSKADILRSIEMEWSRTWLDETLKGVERKDGSP